MIPDATAAHYRAQQAVVEVVTREARLLWDRGMYPASFDVSWRRLGPRLQALLTAGQLRSATMGARYISAVLAELGSPAKQSAAVSLDTLSGVASDGRTLESLLYGTVLSAKRAINAGAAPRQALIAGRGLLDAIVHTQLEDASRVASALAIAATPKVKAYARMLNPPSCKRCAVLAGATYHSLTPFKRHPRCDCKHIPLADDVPGDFRTDPKALMAAGKITGFTAAEQQALDSGADLAQVVNASRGMYSTAIFGRAITATTEGMTPRGLAYRKLDEQGAFLPTHSDELATKIIIPRLTPEQIFLDAAGDRTEAMRLLERFGYLTP